MTGALLLVVVAAIPHLQPRAASLDEAMERYRSAAEAQLRCQDEAAMSAATSIDVPTLKGLTRALGQPASRYRWPPELIASAVALHTRIALTFSADEERAAAEQITASRELLAILPASRPDLYARVAPHWYAIVAAHFQGRLAIVSLARQLDGAPPEFSRSLLLLLARGSMHQLLASAMIPRYLRQRLSPRSSFPQLPEWVASDQRVHRDLAQRDFRAAIAVAPNDAEAYIRLADLLSRDEGGRREAAELLAHADQLPSAGTLKYWGALVSGRMKEDGGDLDGARAAYARAGRLMPAAQAPQVALAHLNLATGHAADAAVNLRAYLGRSALAGDNANDPWWEYMFGQTWRLDSMIDDLLREVRNCSPR